MKAIDLDKSWERKYELLQFTSQNQQENIDKLEKAIRDLETNLKKQECALNTHKQLSQKYGQENTEKDIKIRDLDDKLNQMEE